MMTVLPTLADLHDLTYHERLALRAALGVPADTRLPVCLEIMLKRGLSLGVMLWAIDMTMDANAVTTAPDAPPHTPVNLTSVPHPLSRRYTSDELFLLARKLDIPYAHRSITAVAEDIASIATTNDWTLETLDLLKNTRAMPQFKRKGHPDMLE